MYHVKYNTRPIIIYNIILFISTKWVKFFYKGHLGILVTWPSIILGSHISHLQRPLDPATIEAFSIGPMDPKLYIKYIYNNGYKKLIHKYISYKKI